MRHLLLLASLLSPLSTAAIAQSCPTGADLPGGIAVTDDDGGTETFYPMGPGVIRSVYLGADGESYQTLLGQGIYWLQNVDIEDSKLLFYTRTTNSYPMKPSEMPLPSPGEGWSTDYAFVDETGDVSTRFQSTVFGEATRLTIGACDYDMIPVAIDYPSDNYNEVMLYVPELGIALWANAKREGETLVTTEFLSIQAVNEN